MPNNKIKDLAKPFWLDESNVLVQIRKEYSQGLDSITTKRKLRENDIKEYVPTTKKDKVSINSIYTTIQTLMSVYYTDKMLVNFSGRKETNRAQAENLNRVAQFDYDEMDLESLDYQWNFDAFFFWVWLKLIDGWNSVTNTPIARVHTPLSWIPDPRGWFTMDTHRWAWFEAEDTLWNLKANANYFNTELVNSANAWEQEQIRAAYTVWRSINDQWYEQVENKKYEIYHHYTIIDWFKYLVTTANSNTLIIRMLKLKPITKEEKANPLKVPFPIALKYYSPIKGDPFGISVPDLLRDKQKAESKLFNLAIQKETRITLWDDIFYDPKKIGNVKSLTTPTVNPKAIPVKIREWDNISSTVFRMPKETQPNSAFNANWQIQFQNSLSTWLDANSLGIQSWTQQTATEAQLTQKNANLRFVLWTKVQKWWEATFWQLWKRTYAFNLSPRSKKILYIAKAFWTQYFEFRKRDFITNESIDIKIVSTAEKESLQNAQKADFYAIAPQFLADPLTPEISKRWIKRKMLRLGWMSEEEINIMQPKSVDELNAELDVELINNNQEPLPIQPWQDHLTYIYAYFSTIDNDKKYQAIENRKTQYITEGGEKAQLEQAQAAWQDWTLGNIAQSNASQQTSAQVQEWANQPVWNVNAVGI